MTAGQRGDGAGVDLDVIEARVAERTSLSQRMADSDVPALVAEVRRLREAADRVMDECEAALAERDELRAALAAANERAEAAERTVEAIRQLANQRFAILGAIGPSEIFELLAALSTEQPTDQPEPEENR